MRRRHPLNALAGLAVLAAIVVGPLASPVQAGRSDQLDSVDTGAACSSEECYVGARLRVPGAHGQGAGTGSPSAATPQLHCAYYDTIDLTGSDSQLADTSSLQTGDRVWQQCWLDDGSPYGSPWSITWGPERPAVPAPPVEDIAQLAMDTLRVPLPAAAMNPPGSQVVNLPSWLAVENWAPVSRTATVGDVSATVTATPLRQHWSFGRDGGTVTCLGPGRAYDPGRAEGEQHTDCSLAFTHSSAGQAGGSFTVTTTVEWDVSWTSTVPGRGGGLGVLSSTATRAVQVDEIQVLNN